MQHVSDTFLQFSTAAAGDLRQDATPLLFPSCTLQQLAQTFVSSPFLPRLAVLLSVLLSSSPWESENLRPSSWSCPAFVTHAPCNSKQTACFC